MICAEYKWGTHLPLLTEYALKTTGPIIEQGGGVYSTSALHGICSVHKRLLVTVEANPVWREQLMHFATDWHVIADTIPPRDEWDLALIDGARDARMPALRELEHKTQFLIVHDTEDVLSYGYDFSGFKYKRDWKWLKPWTTVVSHFQRVDGRDG